MYVLNNGRKYEAPASYFRLSDDEVHIWLAPLNQPEASQKNFYALLSPEEKTRASRFYFEKDRRRSIVARGLLRTLLGEYLHLAPEEIQFEYGIHGKPNLPPGLNPQNLQFNLSHSKDKVIYAFTLQKRIGIDIEHIYEMKNMNEFAGQFFTANECEWLHLSPRNQKAENFFKIWTCKEAFLKANGSGLMVPINEVEIQFVEDDRARLFSASADYERSTLWNLQLFSLDGYQVSCAVDGVVKTTSFHEIM